MVRGQQDETFGRLFHTRKPAKLSTAHSSHNRTESVPIDDAGEPVLAEDLVAVMNVPPSPCGDGWLCRESQRHLRRRAIQARIVKSYR